MKEEDLNWLIGLIEGEGTFFVNITIRTGGFGVIPVFKLTLAERDRDVIFSIRDMIGFGRIQFKPNKTWKKQGMANVQNQYVYIVSNIEDAQKLTEILDDKLFRTSKKRDYLLWKEAVNIVKNYRHLTYEGFVRICEIRDQMNLEIKRRNYKNKEYFLKLLKEKPEFFSKKNVQKRRKTSASMRRVNRFIYSR
jgi:hypothetical protein